MKKVTIKQKLTEAFQRGEVLTALIAAKRYNITNLSREVNRNFVTAMLNYSQYKLDGIDVSDPIVYHEPIKKNGHNFNIYFIPKYTPANDLKVYGVKK